ncbi:MAG: hypothetical protein ABIL76_05375 [candidate division WOR-3 bacterium]
MLLITFSALFYRELNFQGIFNYVTSLVPLPNGNYILVMHGPWPNGWNGNLEYNTLVKLDSLGNVISHKAFGINSSSTRFLEILKLLPINNYQRIVGFGYVNFDNATIYGSDPLYMIFDTNLNPIALYNLQSTSDRHGLGFDAFILSDGKLFGWGWGTSPSGSFYAFHGAFFTSINIGSDVNYFWTGPANVNSNLLFSGVRGEVRNDTFIFYLELNQFAYDRLHPYFTQNRGKFNLFFFNTQNPYNYWAKSYRVSIFSDYLKEWIGGYLPVRTSTDPEWNAVLAGDINNNLINGSSVDILPESNGFLVVANGGLWYDSTRCRSPMMGWSYDWVFYKQDRIFIIKFDANGNLLWAKRLVFPGLNWTRGGARRSVCRTITDSLIYTNYLNHQIKIIGVVKFDDSYIIGGIRIIDSTCNTIRLGNNYYCQGQPKRIFSKPFLIKVDTLGNFKWGYYYDIPNPSYPFFFIHENLNRAIVKDFNNNIIMFGTINDGGVYEEVSGVVIKFDSAGNSCLNRTPFTLNTELVDWAADDPSGYYGIGPWGFTHDGWAVSVMTGLSFSGLSCIITPLLNSENYKNCFEIRKNKIVFKTNIYYKIYSIDGKLITSDNSKEVNLKEGAYLIEIRNRRVKVIVP